MAVKSILQIGDSRLKAKNKTLEKSDSAEIKLVIKDLTDTMQKNDIVGIAASQIGVNIKLLITEPRETEYRKIDQSDKLRVYINPRITEYSKEKSTIYEGCGSVGADFFGPVERPRRITIEAYDQEFKKFRLTCDGMLARVIQHEFDHLSGVEFVEKISDYKKVMNFDNYQKQIRTSANQIEESKISLIKYSEL